ncbi:MAG: glutamate-5-semialdehyde dehydrogenase [Woeseiaceae bacterium]|nr:glutamate-5-semialdehyde dehydrogenase [Woeseiaceae bacterium]
MTTTPEIETLMLTCGRDARRAFQALGKFSSGARNGGLMAAADAIQNDQAQILEANAADLEAAREKGLSAAMLDRLALDADRLRGISDGLRSIAALPDTLGVVSDEWERPNGLLIQRVRVPLGVIGIIYESRPNVTVDAAGLCLKSGNAVILRGGSESLRSNRALHEAFVSGLESAGLPGGAVQLVPTTDREAVGFLLSSMGDYVDVIVPRGGRSLVERVKQDARVPVIGHLDGICHIYVHSQADQDKAVDIAVNAKMRRTGICGAAETILVDRQIADTALPAIVNALTEKDCEVRGDKDVCHRCPNAVPATDADWSTEYLDAIVSIRVVDGLDAAIEHIETYGSGHTESIVTEDQEAADRFLADVDSAIVLHNASTQFADGGEFGMGAEIGIATGRIHARGPVGAEQLTSYKYVVRGSGQIRP